MWKRLLVGIDGSAAAFAAARSAFFLARRYDAEVEAVFVSDVRLAAPPLPAADMMGAPLDVPAPLAGVEAEERKRGERALTRVAEQAREAGVRATTALETGLPAPAILARLPACDAVVLGRDSRTGAGGPGSTVTAVARESVRPVLVASRPLEALERILVAFDGSPEATRAIRVACELAEGPGPAPEYSVITVAEDEAVAEPVQAEAATYFAGHGLTPRRIVRRGAPARVICAAAKEWGAHLLVAGSFGGTRIREMLLGSVTHDLIAGCEIPTLVHH